MAVPSNTFQTYQAKGNREDLADYIDRISPTETPFYSALKKVKAKATFTEWQTQDLAATDSANAAIEGDDATANAATPTARLGNYTQISTKTVAVAGTQEAVDKAGRDSEMAYQKMLKGLELRRDIETILLLNQARNAGAAGTARRIASVLAWIATNTDMGVGGANPTGDGTNTRTDGTTRAFTETQLKSVLQQCFTQGGNPTMVMVGPSNKQTASTFTGGATKFDKSEDETVYAAFDVYKSDFGTLKMVPNRFQRTRDAFVLDMNHWAFANLRPLFSKKLAENGDSEREMMVWEYSLIAKQQKASGLVADLT